MMKNVVKKEILWISLLECMLIIVSSGFRSLVKVGLLI